MPRLINKGSSEWNFAEFNDPGRFFHGENQETPEERAAKEEERKQRLRDQLNAIYGIGEGTPQLTGYTIRGGDQKYQGKTMTLEEAQAAQAASAEAGGDNYTGGVFPVYGADPAVAAAQAQMQAEDEKVGSANRDYYTDQLGRAFVKAERNTRFNLARSGLLGSSEDSAQQGEVRSDRDLGATRIDEATRRAVTGLHGAREDARLKGIGLINAGAGDEGVRSASAGLKQSFDTALNAQKADLTSDLFANAVDAYTAQNTNAANRALLARYQQGLGASFSNSGTSSGRVTPTR